MIILQMGIEGSQTKTHCSMTSSIGACVKLNNNLDPARCRMYKKKLEYDWDAHAYKRCEECLLGEIR